MNNTVECSWCWEPIRQGYGYISINNGKTFCSYYCFEKYAYEHLEAKYNILGREEEN